MFYCLELDVIETQGPSIFHNKVKKYIARKPTYKHSY